MRKALALMQEQEDWRQLPGLLEGLHKGDSTPDSDFMQKIVRKAIQADHLGAIINCLNRSALTGMTLKDDAVLNLVMWGMHEHAQNAGWEEERIRKALRYGAEIAQLLEAEEHGSGRKLAPNDPRTRPAVIAVYLELSAVLAKKYQGGSDVDGSVKTYTERLMACFNDANQPAQQDIPKSGPQSEFLSKLPIWHGLSLSKSILSNDLPQASKAQKIISDYEARLSQIVQEIQSDAGKNSSGYASQAITAWNATIRN